MVVATTGSDGFEREAAWFNPLQSWTLFGYFRSPDATATYNTLFTHGDTTFALGNIWFGMDATGLYAYADDGTNHAETPKVTAPVDTVFWAAVVYSASSGSLRLIVDGVDEGLSTSDVLTIPFVDSHQMLLTDDSSGTRVGGVWGGYHRLWQAALNVTELTAEASTITVQHTASLLADCPMQAGIDVTDHNAKARQWYPVGSPTSNVAADPLLTIVAGPPTNITPETALEVLTTGLTAQDTLTAAAATTVWYYCTAPADTIVMGACCFGDLTTYKPTILVFEGLVNAQNNDSLMNTSGQNIPIQFPVTAGLDYYFKATRNGAVTPATALVSVLTALNLTAPIGSLAVPDDEEGRPLAILDADTGYPLAFRQPFATATTGSASSLRNGKVLTIDDPTTSLFLYDSNAVQIATIPLVESRVTTNQVDTFLVGTDGVGMPDSDLTLIAEDGTIGQTFTSVSTNLVALGMNQDATIAYLPTGGDNQAVHRWDLVNDTALSDFVAGVANFRSIKDLVVMTNDDVLVGYIKTTATKNFNVKRYNAAAVLQDTYDFGVLANGDNRMAPAPDDPLSFYVWIKNEIPPINGWSTFSKVRVADGVITKTCTVPQFEGGAYFGPVIETPQRFGHSESCPFWVTYTVIGPDVPVTTTTYPIRRQRRFLLPSSPDNKRVQIPTLELLMRTGIGLMPDAWGGNTPLGAEPQVMFRISKDGGKTWSNERWRTAGEIGQYTNRVRLLRATGQYRNAVLEVTVSDPVDWQFVAMMGEPVEGSS